MPRGRPNLFVNRHVLQVIVSREEYDAIRRMARLERRGFSTSDLVREFIQQGLGRYAPDPKPTDARSARVRRLRLISRTALELAQELKTA
jgi:hypothetical protein